MSTLLYSHPCFLEHAPGPMHPERPERLAAILERLERRPVRGTVSQSGRLCTTPELLKVHTAEHVKRLESTAGTPTQLDADTSTSEGSHHAALWAAGTSAQAVEDVLSGRASNGFVFARPPGHHATPSQPMGFCLFNNVAVAAEAARGLGAERVLILDWDVHHGNGTQDVFFARRDVLFCSSHQFPFYPGTGAPEEVGERDGLGFTVNCALSGGQTDADYGAVFDELFLPIARAFSPSLVLVSAGFDAHQADPLGGMRVTERGFSAMCTAALDLARACCGGKLLLLLEGGYDLDALAQSVHACVEVLAGERRESFPTEASATTRSAVERSRAIASRFWPALAT